MARNMGKRTMGIDEFRLLVSRFPQIFQPPEVLYRLISVLARRRRGHLAPPPAAGEAPHGRPRQVAGGRVRAPRGSWIGPRAVPSIA